ncbi:hypothetical protein [Kocuria rosea]|uniref:hypothetical protein n=1 Tax=Kocuria rosea TaxID=1275 RepID=UPI0011A44124|nr:hypothetical protein [Kocuria rosea]
MTERRSPFVGKIESYDPVEPLWPYGAVAYMYPIPAEKMSDGKPSIGVEKIPITGAHPMPDGGWRVTIGSGLEKKLILDLDEDGESAECIPWNDDLEETYAPKPPDPEPAKQKEKGFFADMWDALREGWREGRPPAPEPAAQKKVTDSMIEGVKKASEARGQKTREDIEKRHQRAEIFDRKVREIRGQADPQPKNEADATTEVGQDQAAEEAARHEHRARG